jgi:hypothetical protein
LKKWDQTVELDFEINAELLHIAIERMGESGLVEWPSAQSVAKMIYLWTLCHAYFRDAGKTEIETYYCPLKDCCSCPVEIRV